MSSAFIWLWIETMALVKMKTSLHVQQNSRISLVAEKVRASQESAPWSEIVKTFHSYQLYWPSCRHE